MRVFFKKLSEKATIPKYAKPNDAGADLAAVYCEWSADHKQIIYGTGLACAIPNDCVGLLCARSSVVKTGLRLANSLGILDAGYRGEIKAVFDIIDHSKPKYEVGDRVIQLVIVPKITAQFIEAASLDDTERGNTGFGSSGK